MKMSFVLKNVYRAKWCERHHMEVISKMLMYINAIVFNCNIDYHCQIPKTTSLSHHGSGVVINPTVKLGENVIVAHGVTIGNRMPTEGGLRQ